MITDTYPGNRNGVSDMEYDNQAKVEGDTDNSKVKVTTFHPKMPVSGWKLPSQFWTMFRQVVILCTIVTTQVLFWYMCSYDHRLSEETIAIYIVFYACDLVYIFDTIFRVVKVYGQTQLIRYSTRWEWIANYFSFTADVVSLLPLEILVLTIDNKQPTVDRSEVKIGTIFDDGSIGQALVYSAFSRLRNFHWTFAVLKLNRIVRLYRIPAFYHGDNKSHVRLNVFAMQTIKLGICIACFLVLLCHSIACIWFSMNCTGVVYTGQPPVCRELGKGFHSIYKYSSLNQTDPFIWYLGGLHWSVMSLRNTGDPVLVPANSNQMLYGVITQLIGFYMTLLLMLMSIHVATILDLKRSKFFHEAEVARNFASRMRLNTESTLGDFIDRSINYMWKKGRGFTDTAMVHLLPNRLRRDIAMHIFKPMVEKSEILTTCFTPEELELLASHVQIKHYLGNSFLIGPKSTGACMFYIIRGIVDVMDDNGTILFTMGTGSLIGEADAFVPRLRSHGIKTRFECDALKLTNSAVTKVFEGNAATLLTVLQIIKKRTEFGLTANAEAEEALNSQTPSSTSVLSEEHAIDVEDEVGDPDSSPVAHISPFAWLKFFHRNPKNLASTMTAINTKSILEEFEQLPEATTKYTIIQVAPWPDHRWEYGIVSKNSNLAELWNFIVFAVALLYSYGLPVCVMLNRERETWWVDVFVDLVNMSDLIFRLLVFYKPSEMHHSIPQRLAHIKREFKNPSILLSLIPALPFHQIWRFAGTSYRSYLYVRLHLYAVRLITVHLYFRKWEHDVRINVILLRMLKNTLYISIYVFFFTCIFCSFGCVAYPNCQQTDGETWVGQYLKSIPPNSTIYVQAGDVKEFYYAFYLSLYWSLSSMFGIGYTTDYLLLVQKKETTLFTVHLVLSFVVLTYFFADVGSAISAQIDNTVHHLCAKVSLLRYLDDELADLSIMEQVTTFLELQERILFGTVSSNQGGFLQVSHTMFKELFVSAVAETLHSAYFFQFMNPHVLKSFCGICKLIVLPPNVCLMAEGELVDGLYVLRRGYAEVYKGGTDILVDILSVGQSFGDIEFIYNQPSRVTIRAVTYVELISISKEDFSAVLATSEFHSQEVADLTNHPEAHEWFQENFLVTKSEWQKHQYVPPEPPPQIARLYAFNGDHTIPPEQDPYLSVFEFLQLKWIRWCLLPCGFIPTGPLVHLWAKVQAIVTLLQLIYVPIVQTNPYLRRDHMGMIYILDFFCIIDMIVAAHTGYYDRKTRTLVTHPLFTAKRYFMGRFWLDLSASFVTYILIDRFLTAIAFEGPRHGTRFTAYFLRMNRLIRAYRCWPYVKEKLGNLTGKPNWKIAVLLSLVLLFETHFVTCMTIVLACPTSVADFEKQDGICYPGTWIREGKHTRLMLARNETIRGGHIYLFAFYYTVTTAVGCGFGDFKPVGKLEQILTAFQLFTYMILFTYIIAKVGSSRSLYDYKLLKFQHSMKHLVGWLNRESVSLDLMKRILRHYDYYWMRTEGVRIEELWSYLYPTVKKNVMYDTYEDVFRLVPEFNHVPIVFMREVLACIQLRHYLNHEVIVRIGDVCEYIYIIGGGNMMVKLGTLTEITDDDMIQLGEGGILGSMDPTVSHALHDCTAVCWTNVDMFVIKRVDFIRILQKYPDVAAVFVIPPQSESRNARVARLSRAATMKAQPASKEEEANHLNLSKTSTLRATLRRELNAAIANQTLVPVRVTVQLRSPEQAILQRQYELITKKEEKARYGTKEIFASSLLPVSKNYQILDNICFYAAVVSSGVTAFQFAFKRFEWVFWILGMVTDATFILKMILRFFITYYDEMGDLISNVMEMEKGYLSTYDGFIMDLFTALPFELFTLIYAAVAPASPQKQQVAFLFWASLRLNRLLRLHFVMKHISQMLREAGITVNLVFLKIKRLIITTLVLLHWLVIVFYVTTVSFKGRGEDACDSNSTRIVHPDYHEFIPRSWTETKMETGHRLCFPYIMTLYFLVDTFTATGYGDIYPVTPFEILFISLLAITSKVYVAMALMDVLSGIQYYIDKSFHISADATLKLYHDYGLPNSILHRVKAYFHYGWQQNAGVIIPEFLLQAPEVHLFEICYDAYGHVLENSTLFQNLPLPFHQFVCTKLHSVWILDGDCIVNQGDLGDRLYFLHRGVVESRRETYDEDGELDISSVEYCMGTSFGEINGLIGTSNYQRTYIARTNVDLVYVTFHELEVIFEVFPAERVEILGRLRNNFPKYDEDKAYTMENYTNSD